MKNYDDFTELIFRCFDCPRNIPPEDFWTEENARKWITLNEAKSEAEHNELAHADDCPPFQEGTLEDWGECYRHYKEADAPTVPEK